VGHQLPLGARRRVVRYAPMSGPYLKRLRRPSRAISGPSAAQQNPPYLDGLGDVRCERHDLDSLVGEERDDGPGPSPQAGFGSSNAFEPELFRKTALLACEREILEFPTKQNWFDTDNDHFRSAVGTC
jgi:hypothetical protein